MTVMVHFAAPFRLFAMHLIRKNRAFLLLVSYISILQLTSQHAPEAVRAGPKDETTSCACSSHHATRSCDDYS